MYYKRDTKEYIKVETNKSLKFLYYTIIGRIILKIVISKPISIIYAFYMNSRLSKRKIKKFVSKNNINLSDYEKEDYSSFNAFFIRKIKPKLRPIGKKLIAVCDAKLSAYKLTNDESFMVKGRTYTVSELTRDTKKYQYALIFRLCVDDYHHYIYPDDGEIVSTKIIPGRLHTVQPIALSKYPVFHENTRVVTNLKCRNLANVCYIEVGALMVGKIVNLPVKTFKKGDEKGHFEFGGSTIIMLIDKDIKIDKDILENTKKDIETIVKMGEKIGDY